MEEVIWIEVLSRQRAVVSRHRCRGPEIRVGRAYDNDVVVDDPYVAPAHVRIARDADGALVAEDLGSANGLFADRSRARAQRIRLGGDRTIRIGHTLLRAREAGHPVAKERRLQPRSRAWLAACVLGAAVLAIEILTMWLGETAEPKLSRYATPLITITLLVLAWTAGWAILSRIFASEARFERNLVIALGGLLLYSLYNEAARFGAFAFSSRLIASYGNVLVWGLIALVSFFHLRAIGPTRLKLKGAAVAALAVAVILVQTLSQSEMREVYGHQTSLQPLMPPALRMTAIKDRAAFTAGIEDVRRALDQDRTEPPSTGFLGSLFGFGRD